SAVLTASGELAEDPDDPTYLRVSLFDLDTGTIQPLKLPETPPIPNQFVVSVREGPFLRVTSAASPCLELRVDPGKGEATGACAVPNVL
ncbi:hypothetical protein ACKI1K_44925, partial [Streptomyces scabiei]|uniref:hypothetical protein n=1 Tax=Streptomyces scabiei TaxID=1930 RepID=UPI0038F7E98A